MPARVNNIQSSASFDPERVKLHTRNSCTHRNGLLPPGNAGGASHQHLHVVARLFLLTLDLRLAVVVVSCKQASAPGKGRDAAVRLGARKRLHERTREFSAVHWLHNIIFPGCLNYANPE